MESATVEEAGHMLLSSRHIVVFGISPNNILGELFKRKMESIGHLVYIANMGESGMIANSLTEKDCAVLISYSGNNENREPMRYIKALKENNVNW